MAADQNMAKSEAPALSPLEEQILRLLQNRGKLAASEIAELIGSDPETVSEAVSRLESQNTILGYGAMIDWTKARTDDVTGLIEVRVTPQRGRGFDQIARRIYNFPEVSSCYLMSGDYDLLVTVEGRNLRDVADFVSDKIAVISDVLSTRTHFILKKYKLAGHILTGSPEDDREVLVL